MKAVDASVLLRLATRDDPREVAAAEAFIAGGAWVSHLVLAEVVSVLAFEYSLGPQEIGAAVGILLEHQSLTLQDADVVGVALERFRAQPALGFAGCLALEVARKAGNLPVGTLEPLMGALPGAVRL